MTLADFFDAVARLSLVLLTLSSLAAVEMILTMRMIRVPKTLSAPPPQSGGKGEITRHGQE